MTDKHTPTARPWYAHEFYSGKETAIRIEDVEGDVLRLSGNDHKERAAHIVKAVNAYDDLMKLVEAVGKLDTPTILAGLVLLHERGTSDIIDKAINTAHTVGRIDAILNKVKGNA